MEEINTFVSIKTLISSQLCYAHKPNFANPLVSGDYYSKSHQKQHLISSRNNLQEAFLSQLSPNQKCHLHIISTTRVECSIF